MRLLPWVHALRRAKRSYGFDNCKECTLPEHRRGDVRCGWRPESEWADDDDWHATWRQMRPGAADVDAPQCPGYMLQLPTVVIVPALWMWWDKGQLRDRCEGPPPPFLCMLIEAFNGEHCAAQSWEMDERTKG